MLGLAASFLPHTRWGPNSLVSRQSCCLSGKSCISLYSTLKSCLTEYNEQLDLAISGNSIWLNIFTVPFEKVAVVQLLMLLLSMCRCPYCSIQHFCVQYIRAILGFMSSIWMLVIFLASFLHDSMRANLWDISPPSELFLTYSFETPKVIGYHIPWMTRQSNLGLTHRLNHLVPSAQRLRFLPCRLDIFGQALHHWKQLLVLPL